MKPLRTKFSVSKIPFLNERSLQWGLPFNSIPNQSRSSVFLIMPSPGMNRQSPHSSHLAMAMRSQLSLTKLWRWRFQVTIFQVRQFAQAIEGEVIGCSPELTSSVHGIISSSVVENMPRFAHHLTLLNMLFLSGDLIFASI